MKHLFVWSLRFIGIFLFSLTFIPELYAIEGSCIPTPPCYCNEECFRCGPGGCSSGGPSSSAPAYDYEAERQRQEAERQRQLETERRRQLELEEQRKREDEVAKKKQEEFEQSKQDALKSMKGITERELGLKGTDAGGLGLKDIGDKGKGTLGLKGLENNKEAVPKKSKKELRAKSEKMQNGWQKALGCVMEDVYARADSLGSVGVKFSQDLRKEMKKVFNKAGKPVKDKDSEKIVSLFLDRPTVKGDFIVSVAVFSKDNSNVEIDVQSYFSESEGKIGKQESLQTLLTIDKYGEVIDGHETASAGVKACLAR
jgi:hypothetical protein